MTKAIPLFIIGLFLIAAVSGQIHASASIGDNVFLTWDLNEPYITITATFLNSYGWAGIGWKCAGNCTGLNTKMNSGDFAVAQFDSNGQLISISDMSYNRLAHEGEYSGGPAIIDTDATINGTNDIFNMSGYTTQNPPLTTFTFTRRLNTGDTHGDNVIQNLPTTVMWACTDSSSSPSLTMKWHGNSYGTHTVNFYTGATGDQGFGWKKTLHATAMTIAFGVLMPFSIFVSRFLKPLKWWFPLHIIINTVAVGFIALGFALALIFSEGMHFDTLHSKFGLATVCLTALAPVLGFIADRLFQPSRRSVPIWPDVVHWWVGRVTVAMGATTIIMGMLLIGLDHSMVFGFAGLLAFYVFVHVLCDVLRWWYGTPSDEEVHHALLSQS